MPLETYLIYVTAVAAFFCKTARYQSTFSYFKQPTARAEEKRVDHCWRFECKLCSNDRSRVRTFCHNRDFGHGFCLDQMAGGCLSRMDWVSTDRIKRNSAGYPSQQRRHGVSIVPTGFLHPWQIRLQSYFLELFFLNSSIPLTPYSCSYLFLQQLIL